MHFTLPILIILKAKRCILTHKPTETSVGIKISFGDLHISVDENTCKTCKTGSFTFDSAIDFGHHPVCLHSKCSLYMQNNKLPLKGRFPGLFEKQGKRRTETAVRSTNPKFTDKELFLLEIWL
jgi:hypothetical protein